MGQAQRVKRGLTFKSQFSLMRMLLGFCGRVRARARIERESTYEIAMYDAGGVHIFEAALKTK